MDGPFGLQWKAFDLLNKMRLLKEVEKHAFLAELHPRAKRARGRSPIAKEMW